MIGQYCYDDAAARVVSVVPTQRPVGPVHNHVVAPCHRRNVVKLINNFHISIRSSRSLDGYSDVTLVFIKSERPAQQFRWRRIKCDVKVAAHHWRVWPKRPPRDERTFNQFAVRVGKDALKHNHLGDLAFEMVLLNDIPV